MYIDTILARIQALPPKSTPYIIAVDGFGGSGKSTAAHALQQRLPRSVIVAMDDFINKDHFYDDSWELAFDREAVGARVASLSQSDALYVIVEGISSTHPSLATLYDFTIWVDAPIDVAKSRGQLRDKGNENENKWNLWAQNDLRYLEVYGPKERASAVISNKSDVDARA